MKYIIKQSNSGNIHALAASSDRVIDFGDKYAFAMVLPEYYGHKIYKFNSQKALVAKYLMMRNYEGIAVFDNDGYQLSFEGDCFALADDQIKLERI